MHELGLRRLKDAHLNDTIYKWLRRFDCDPKRLLGAFAKASTSHLVTPEPTPVSPLVAVRDGTPSNQLHEIGQPRWFW
jgi:hypothetical protein